MSTFLPTRGGGVQPTAGAEADATQPPRIRIEHEVVRIPVTEVNTVVPERPEPSQPSRRGAARAATPSAPGARAARRDGETPRGLVQRTVRTIVGDGRYRPQPFPTLQR